MYQFILHYQYNSDMSSTESCHLLTRNAMLRMPLRLSRSTSPRWAKCTGRTGKPCRGSRLVTLSLVTSWKLLVGWPPSCSFGKRCGFVAVIVLSLCHCKCALMRGVSPNLTILNVACISFLDQALYHTNLHKIRNLMPLQLLYIMFCLLVGFMFHLLEMKGKIRPSGGICTSDEL